MSLWRLEKSTFNRKIHGGMQLDLCYALFCDPLALFYHFTPLISLWLCCFKRTDIFCDSFYILLLALQRSQCRKWKSNGCAFIVGHYCLHFLCVCVHETFFSNLYRNFGHIFTFRMMFHIFHFILFLMNLELWNALNGIQRLRLKQSKYFKLILTVLNWRNIFYKSIHVKYLWTNIYKIHFNFDFYDNISDFIHLHQLTVLYTQIENSIVAPLMRMYS